VNASVISRALRRDAGIIAVPINRAGYHVRAGSIAVSCSDLPESRADGRRAAELREHLVAIGWDIEPLSDGGAILRVNRVPKASERKEIP
jgi:hypothetical protein